jgi:hypothetical protein
MRKHACEGFIQLHNTSEILLGLDGVPGTHVGPGTSEQSLEPTNVGNQEGGGSRYHLGPGT